jgi:hypothetical protein
MAIPTSLSPDPTTEASMSDQPEATPSDAPLQFDRAIQTDPSAGVALACSHCSRAITDAYYHHGDQTLCAACGNVRQSTATPDRSVRTLASVIAFGGGAALVGALAYWGVMEFLELEIGIVAIAIGWLVGRAVAKATRGRSARRHQVMALGLTYLAVALAYAPFAVKEWKKEAQVAKVAADSVAAAMPTHAATADTPADSMAVIQAGTPAGGTTGTVPAKEERLPGGLAVALLAVGGILLALPIIAALGSMPGGLLSLLIIGFGLRQAWTVSVASNSAVTGPHAVGSAAAG